MSNNSQLFAKLKELNELKEQNLISAELFERKRREFLRKINSNNVYESEIIGRINSNNISISEINAQSVNALKILVVVLIFIAIISLAYLVINM